MANAVRWLAEKEAAQGTQYVSVQPAQAGPWHDWQVADRGVASGGAVGGSGGEGRSNVLPWPGLYKDPSGQWHAVTLAGLASPATGAPLAANPATSPAGVPETPPAIAPPAVPAQDYLATVAALPLPPPKSSAYGKELWPVLALAAMLMWLAGWTLRLR
jgi:hypothetical protein